MFSSQSGKKWFRPKKNLIKLRDSPKTPYCCGVSLTSPSGPPGMEETREARSLIWLRVLASLLLAQDTCETASVTHLNQLKYLHNLHKTSKIKDVYPLFKNPICSSSSKNLNFVLKNMNVSRKTSQTYVEHRPH